MTIVLEFPQQLLQPKSRKNLLTLATPKYFNVYQSKLTITFCASKDKMLLNNDNCALVSIYKNANKMRLCTISGVAEYFKNWVGNTSNFDNI